MIYAHAAAEGPQFMRRDTTRFLCSAPAAARHTDTIYGDYYDEAFMLEIYKEQAANMWNRLED